MTGTVMTRRTFVTSRDLDFFTRENLAKQIGHAPRNWAHRPQQRIDRQCARCDRIRWCVA